MAKSADVLDQLHPAVREWFRASFKEPTPPQTLGWPPIMRGESTLLLAPTGTGKTLAAFMTCIDRLMFEAVPPQEKRCRILYVSPMKALAVDVERNLRSPLVGIAAVAAKRGDKHHVPTVAVRSGDTPQSERARFSREPTDILITTPESLYLLVTSNAREALRSVETVIIDEIHALVPTKRGAHLALSLERLEALTGRSLQRVGLSATQRPLDEVARFLGGVQPRKPLARSTRHAARTTSAISDEAVQEVEVGKRSAPRNGTSAKAAAGKRRAASEESGRNKSGEDAGAEERSETFGDETSEQVVEEVSEEFREAADVAEYRPVTVVDAGAKKRVNLTIEVPVEDMARPGQAEEIPSGSAAQPPKLSSIWAAIHPRLLELIKEHTSTLLFVNSRRLAERLAASLNELAGETMVMAHHGSIARLQRLQIEDNLKLGRIKALVATSSLELGIDMGSVDLVIQIEAPPSVASGMQRIGRASHQVGGESRGIVFPKYRGDLVACAALTRAMHDGMVESTRYPRNPLDVLAQHIVAMVAMDSWDIEDLFRRIRQSAPYADLSRSIFEGVLDMLAGRYVSDEFAELKPRITWDRIGGQIKGREGAKRVAVINGGTIPDRGLYGVFLAGGDKKSARVGELDEEMVFECKVGETFLLGASTWRIEEITHDKVLVSPAPGAPGKMPFWHGDSATRPLELGQKIGALIRKLRALPAGAAADLLGREHDLDRVAAQNLLQYLADQEAASSTIPDDRTLVIERTRDELGDWRICVLSPLGGQVLAPWSMAVLARGRAQLGVDVEGMWTNDGFVVRVPESDEPPDVSFLLPTAEEVEKLVMDQLGGSALFAARFRECAARALLLPKRNPARRAPLWQQRRRASDLLAAASKYPSFPMLLETYRECLRDVFDMPALQSVLRDVQARRIRVVTVDSSTPSPFASSILFGFVANYLYEGDAPLAERRAQALAIDQTQLRELLGDAELRELLDADAIADLEQALQCVDERYRAKSIDGVHDLLLRIGDLSQVELERRSVSSEVARGVDVLVQARRAVPVALGGETRFLAVEDAARYRDALGVVIPPGLPDSLLRSVPDARGDLVARYARTHGPFTTDEFAQRYGMARGNAEAMLRAQLAAGRILEGAFRPGGREHEWCDPEVLRQIRRRSLAKLRNEVEPVDPRVFGRFLGSWHGLHRKRSGLDALLDAIEKLQGIPLPASVLESEILPARIDGYLPGDLDAVAAAGEVVWIGVEPMGEYDGRIALYLTDSLAMLRRSPEDTELSGRERAVVEHLQKNGASFFDPLHQAAGGGFPNETIDALWGLVWKGLVTNDTFRALRGWVRRASSTKRDRRVPATGRAFRSRRVLPPSAEGRWALVASRAESRVSSTEWSHATAQQLLSRYGVVTREVAQLEGLPGGFSAVYDVFKLMEESGRIRRGYFIADVGGLQFALPHVLDVLRSLRDAPPELELLTLSVVDPANPYGALLKWPTLPPTVEGGRGPTRTAGAHVIIVNGALTAWLSRGGRQLFLWLPESEPDRTVVAEAVARRMSELSDGHREGLLVAEINGKPSIDNPFSAYLEAAGFLRSHVGYYLKRRAGSLNITLRPPKRGRGGYA